MEICQTKVRDGKRYAPDGQPPGQSCAAQSTETAGDVVAPAGIYLNVRFAHVSLRRYITGS